MEALIRKVYSFAILILRPKKIYQQSWTVFRSTLLVYGLNIHIDRWEPVIINIILRNVCLFDYYSIRLLQIFQKTFLCILFFLPCYQGHKKCMIKYTEKQARSPWNIFILLLTIFLCRNIGWKYVNCQTWYNKAFMNIHLAWQLFVFHYDWAWLIWEKAGLWCRGIMGGFLWACNLRAYLFVYECV